jgi:DNA polymerase III subunit delta'
MLLGFNSIKPSLLDSLQNQKLHHAILLHGKKGIGKSSFAKEFVMEVFQTKNSNHPDLLLIEKEPEKKEITVDKIRKISEFANQTSAISAYKFIIIDSACELNKSASNAILKILEEPHKNTFLILISHNLGKVLPTIRSRCQIVKVSDLSLENFSEILRKKNPSISAGELQFLSEICDNSPADAINMGKDLTKIYELFLTSLNNKKISEELLKKLSDKNFSFTIFEKIYEFFINRLLKNLTNAPLNFFLNEEVVFLNLMQKSSVQEIFVIADESLTLLHKTTFMNLDKKLTLINIFNQLN